MKGPILFTLLAASLLKLTASPVQQQPSAQKARIEGIVVRAGTGDALPRARVTVTRYGRGATNAPAVRGGTPVPPPAPIPSVSTDPQGRFVIENLDEASYTMQVLANGYVDLNYGQHYT